MTWKWKDDVTQRVKKISLIESLYYAFCIIFFLWYNIIGLIMRKKN
jgi:hypothetical protein